MKPDFSIPSWWPPPCGTRIRGYGPPPRFGEVAAVFHHGGAHHIVVAYECDNHGQPYINYRLESEFGLECKLFGQDYDVRRPT